MCTSTGRVKLLLAAYAAFICVVHHSCRAQVEHNTTKDCASSCGNIHNIAYPFRLNTDPEHCGTRNYQLSCENNVLLLYLVPYGEPVYGFPVKAINYNNLTIRLLEPNVLMDNCALPTIANRSVYDYFFPYWSSNYTVGRTSVSKNFEAICRLIIFISCPYPINESLYEAYNSPCNLTSHWYLNVMDKYFDFDVFHVENSCRIEAIGITSLLPSTAKNISYEDLKNSFSYGFELSWHPACCDFSEVSRKYNCSDFVYYYSPTLEEEIRRIMTFIFDMIFYCLDKTKIAAFFPGMLASLNKTLDGQYYDYYEHRLTICGLIIYFLFAILAVLELYKALLCVLGSICVAIFLIYKWRKRHLSAYDNIEEFLQSHYNHLMPVRYSYSEIKKFTRNFKEKLGEGGYGYVYKGKLRSGILVAIKILNKSKADGQDFINEVATIGRIHHVNVVQLIGFCVEGSKRALTTTNQLISDGKSATTLNSLLICMNQRRQDMSSLISDGEKIPSLI